MKIESYNIDSALPGLLENFPVAFAYVYGSAAKGEAHPESDLDLAIEFSAETADQDNLLYDKLLPAVSRALKLPTEKIDLKIFHGLPLSVRFRVIKNGRLIYLKEKEVFRHRRLAVATLAQYHDEVEFFDQAARAFFKRKAEA